MIRSLTVVARHFVGSHRELCRISVPLLLWLGILLSVVTQPWFIEMVVNRLALSLSALLAALLQGLGNDVERSGVIISTATLNLEITHKCTAVYQIAVYSAGVLAHRTCFRNKAFGLFWGAIAISIANVIRIVAVFYVGVYAPEWIPLAHNVLGEVLMILLVPALWMFWERSLQSRVQN